MSIQWLVARGRHSHGVAATAKKHTFRIIQENAMHWEFIFAPNRAQAIRVYKERYPL